MDQIGPSPKRQRVPTERYVQSLAQHRSRSEEMELKIAMENSKSVQSRDTNLADIPFGPVFHPSVEEFSQDPLKYIEAIRPLAEKYGICKIVPPAGWDPPFALDVDSDKTFSTKDQSIHRLQEGISFGDGKDYTIKGYQKMCSGWSKEWKAKNYSPAKPTNSSPPATAFSNGSVISNGVTAVPDLNGSVITNGLCPAPPIPSTPSGPQSSRHESTSVHISAQTGSTNLAHDEPKKFTPENLEREYWDIVETQTQSIDVDYGNDVDTDSFGSAFPLSDKGRSVNSSNFLSQSSVHDDLAEPAFGSDDYYKETFWNLNNIPNSPYSVLRHLKIGVNGINVPWLYFGCLFSTFCWHNEDNYMYSINYHHKGAPKQWYGVPGTKHDADGVEQVFKKFLSIKMRDVPDLLHHITTSFSPRLLQNEGVRVCKILQKEGEFVITFPRAFHGGFSFGPNVGEAVNFALQDWIPHAVAANERYRSFGRPSVFSHDRLVYTMAHHYKELRTKEICHNLIQELTRLKEEELLLRKKLISAGVRDVSGDVELPPNRLDKLDDESADYDDKRLCHSCKHICFFSAVCCECSDSKVSCLRHSHYMCRCHISRKFMLVWTPEEEMKDAIANVKKRMSELEGINSQSQAVPTYESLVDAPGTEKDREEYKVLEVSVEPLCKIEDDAVPQLESSDVSVCSSVEASGTLA